MDWSTPDAVIAIIGGLTALAGTIVGGIKAYRHYSVRPPRKARATKESVESEPYPEDFEITSMPPYPMEEEKATVRRKNMRPPFGGGPSLPPLPGDFEYKPTMPPALPPRRLRRRKKR